MAEEKKRKGGGAKLARTETVTVRLDGKLRYLAELAARKQRRTLSSFIEWAVQDSLERVILRAATADEPAKTVASQAAHLWDVDDVARFVKLATDYPELLTYEEQLKLNLLVKMCIWDDPDYDPNASEPQTLDANRKTLSHRIEMVRFFWKEIRQMEEEGADLSPGFAAGSLIAEAARQSYLKRSELTEPVRLLHETVNVQHGKD